MIGQRILWRRTALILANGLAACGGDGGRECESFSSCGGDLIGTWSFGEICAEAPEVMIPGCPESSVDTSVVTASGTITFVDDGTYSAEASLSLNTEIVLPQTCLPDGSSCDVLSNDEFTCSASGSNCRCEGTIETGPTDETGTWESSGSSVMLGPAGEEPTTLEFCVEGDVLKLQLEGDEVTTTYVLHRI